METTRPRRLARAASVISIILITLATLLDSSTAQANQGGYCPPATVFQSSGQLSSGLPYSMSVSELAPNSCGTGQLTLVQAVFTPHGPGVTNVRVVLWMPKGLVLKVIPIERGTGQTVTWMPRIRPEVDPAVLVGFVVYQANANRQTAAI
ncbi:MAG TPA: hypothetical protein VI322_02520 [Candidatus Saccharimonadia bacterium]